METEEVIKLVDGIYKNILDKFNPGARQLISAGKAYLKALHGAASASRLFNEALAKIAVNAQQGGTTDIGSALMSIVGVYKEIQDQHMNILKAFYVDLLVPLETNLEKDTKVVQFEQKKFLQQHKIRADSYSKATATMKKQRKKKNNSQSAEKEIKSIQAMEEEKNKLDTFCEQSLKNAMTQERRRYGFVLERQCSLAKHWMAYHTAGRAEIENSLDNWGDIAGTREFLPPNVENIFKKRMRENMNDDGSDRGSINSALRKTRSIDASCMDMRSIGDVVNNSTINRAKSEYNLTFTTASIQPELNHWDQRPVAKALYAYLSSGENQLSFLEGDRIALVGERAKGWQFGENLRTQMFGWFPLAYTESEGDDTNTMTNWDTKGHRNDVHHNDITPDSSLESTLVDDHVPTKINSYNDDASPTRMFGDTIMYRQSKQFRRISGGPPKPGPPPTLPAPVPTPVVPPYSKNHHLTQSHSFSSTGGGPVIEKRKPGGPATMNLSKTSSGNKVKSVRDGVTNASLHSSNDSGFANEPPPQPEIDYSDEETVTRVPLRSPRHEKSLMTSNVHIPRQSQQRRSNDDSADLTLSRSIDSTNNNNNNNIRSSSYGNLTDENTIDFMYRTSENGNLIKRTKSFWKFGKSDDILEGMALWKHRDLVQTEDEKYDEQIKETTLKRISNNNNNRSENTNSIRVEKKIDNNMIINNNNNNNNNNSNINNISNNNNNNNNNHSSNYSNSTNSSETLKHNGKNTQNLIIDDKNKFPITKSDIDHRISKHNEENIYGVQTNIITNNKNHHHHNGGTGTPPQKQQQQQQQQQKQQQQNHQQSKQQQQQQQQPQPIKTNNNNNNKQQTRQSYINNIMDKDDSTIDRRSRKQQNYIDNHQNDQDLIINKKGYYDSQENLHMIDDMSLLNNDSIRMRETDFYDDEDMQDDMMMMKTVKRKEILKQYYSSGTDEQNSSSSDPYDCIVVDDHLVRKENNNSRKKTIDKMEFTTFRGDKNNENNNNNNNNIIIDSPRTGTLLPRTKLVKTSSVGPVTQTAMLMDKEKVKRESDEQKKNAKNRMSSNNKYGPWYDLWANDESVKK